MLRHIPLTLLSEDTRAPEDLKVWIGPNPIYTVFSKTYTPFHLKEVPYGFSLASLWHIQIASTITLLLW